jgi:hypothetical protein
MADILTTDELIETRKSFRLPDSADSWREAGKPMPSINGHVPTVTVEDCGEPRLGTIVYVTRDGWAGVVLDGEARCDEWPAGRLAVD